jgi:hypothetical protein
VYCLRNSVTKQVLLGSALNLASMRSKVEFARSTNSPSALDHRLRKDIEKFGVEAFTLEVLETFQPTPEMTSAEIHEELTTLEQLHRERFDSTLLY